ncbi:hypothetical protein ATK17_0354 [Branchiibius hedensis]|uniref:Alpha/beta hydrolase family protein n=1 Tax=Branchiibius hedensis TaxID=672460 RepID=A0A2Y9C0T4_9MICO|nr:alpha/beta hydrolase [Branchiibius hedensis]PWJ24266.1 hypothetical protein ATK17_0354 [Branchiibius hedensis]SSA33083.1 hypothetical protein SAMN04489750_0354 [Branchiibius hedensis]
MTTDSEAIEDAVLVRLLANEEPPGRLCSYGPGTDQVWEEYGDPRHPLTVLVHGGYFRPSVDRTYLRPMAVALAAIDLRVVLAEYRRIPGAPWASAQDLRDLDDVLGAATWVGHSAGGALVMRHGAERTRSTVALAPVGDFAKSYRGGHGRHAVRDWIGGSPQDKPADWKALDPSGLQVDRLTILHGDLDQAVPPHVNADLEVQWIRGAHHFDLVDPDSRFWPDVSASIAAATRG